MVKSTQGLAGLGGLVYSTESGRTCPRCRAAIADCVCAQPGIPEGDGIARVRRETKGRGGKTVTTVSGLCLAPDDLKRLAKELKARCGCGGGVKEGVIEIQGDKADFVCNWLIGQGYQTKRAGG
ncbi:translation initiation factor Sui1 [Halopseudomonas pelagia]|uniref:translation initiation factor Sui1 n=1 Tax=Halopseudomonas pelagia TaxID=553151 RepID=UPI0003A8E7EB|nr:translation initiation factor Sui1 [Halopseudomonas pelagia]|tara:strand:- start:192803 stop:193174 length:372 start_codon:yes stop_codon:yes gene_type:complete